MWILHIFLAQFSTAPCIAERGGTSGVTSGIWEQSRIRAHIDGLRAIAVFAVVVSHASDSRLPGRYIGVDIFFVLSGYLISGILLRDHAQGRASLTNFYSRRIRRIFPALLLRSVGDVAGRLDAVVQLRIRCPRTRGHSRHCVFSPTLHCGGSRATSIARQS